MPAKDVTVPSTLKGEAKKVWLKIYQAAWDSYDPKKSKAESREAYAASVAWAGLKSAGYKKGEKGDWVKKSLAQNVAFSLRFTKARHDAETGKIRWHAQAANDEMDGQDEALDPTLFTDFAENFQVVMVAYATGQTSPDFGHGPAQLPILDVSHYSSLLPPDKRDSARVGSILKLYRDGRYLHADGYFDDTDIGHLAAKSVLADEEGVLRTSVGFWPDWGNIEVRNDVLFFKGGRRKAYLDHIAITSVPRIKSTTIDAEEEVTMSEATSMAEDALAVLGDESVVAGLEQLIEAGEPKTESMVLRAEESVEEVSEEEVVEEEAVVEDTVEEVSETAEPEVEANEDAVLESQVVEADVGGPEKCVCPECSYSTDKVRGTPCRDMECPECGAGLVAGTSKEKSESVEMSQEKEWEQMSEGDREKARDAQKARSKKYGITILPPPRGNVTKPGKWESLKDSQFGDPVNYRYPIHDIVRIRNARPRFAQEEDSYKGKGVVGKRIEAAAKKFKIGEYKKDSEAVSETIVEQMIAAGELIPESEIGPVGAEEMQTETDVTAVMEVPVEVINLPFGGATSFDEAVEHQKAINEQWRVEDGWYVLKTVIDNIMASNDVEDPKATIAKALDQYTAFLQSGENLMSGAVETEAVEEVATGIEGITEVEGGTLEDLEGVEMPEPVTSEPPESQPMSVVSSESLLGSRSVTSFGDALARLGNMNIPVPKKQAAVRELSQIAESEIQRELVGDANVGELVEAAVEQAMVSVGAELAQIRELLTRQSVPGSQSQTPQRPERKSYKPNIQPAKVTTQARTFSDVIDRLLG